MKLHVLAMLAPLGAIAIFLLFAALQCFELSKAQKRTIEYLENWGGKAPVTIHVWLRKTIGATVIFVLAMALAFGLNRLGETSMPTISKMFKHFNEPYTAWSVEQQKEWTRFKRDVRKVWSAVHEQDIVNDLDSLNKWKDDRGITIILVAQTLVFFSIFLLVAGIVDLAYSLHIVRGVVVLVIGLCAFVITVHLWTEQKSHYVRQVYLANRTLGENAVAPPKSYPHEKTN